MIILFLGLAAFALYGSAVGFLWLKQESLLFAPTPLAADHRLANDPDVHELSVDVPGAKLSALHLRLPQPKGVVFFLHGNAGNLASWFTNADFYRRANFDLVMLDYRGYGKSTGRIENEAQLRADVRALWKQVAPLYEGKRVVVYGRSLGSALAADLAAELSAAGHPPDMTMLVSPYSSMRALTDEFYPWVPTAVLRYPLDTANHALGIRGPVMLIHGDRDTLIGPHHSERIKSVLPQAQLLSIGGAGHGDVHEFPSYLEAVAGALNRL